MPIRRVGRPGLVGTMARTAVVAGTASAVVGGVHHRQEARYGQQQAASDQEAYEQQQMADMQAQMAQMQAQQAQQQAAAGTATATAPQPDRMAQLKDLAALKESGILTDAEFEAEKRKILGS